MIRDLISAAIDEESKPYWEGLKEEKLYIQYCSDCQKSIFYPRTLCPHCFSDEISWHEALGTGTIYSFTTVHQAFGPFKDDIPFVVGVVELDEGVRMMTRILGDKDQIAIDKKVAVVFKKIADDFVLPYFEVI